MVTRQISLAAGLGETRRKSKQSGPAAHRSAAFIERQSIDWRAMASALSWSAMMMIAFRHPETTKATLSKLVETKGGR
jgi:hypothetical protein